MLVKPLERRGATTARLWSYLQALAKGIVERGCACPLQQKTIFGCNCGIRECQGSDEPCDSALKRTYHAQFFATVWGRVFKCNNILEWANGKEKGFYGGSSDHLTASAIATLAFQKFIESGAGELAKKFTGAAIVKMDELRQRIWDTLRGKSPRVDEALVQVERGDHTTLTTIPRNLDVVMEEYPGFARRSSPRAGSPCRQAADRATWRSMSLDQARDGKQKLKGGPPTLGKCMCTSGPQRRWVGEASYA